MRKLSNCVSGCDFTTPLFISTDTVFQSDSKVSLQASFIAIFRYFSQTVIFVLLDWFVGLEASSGLSCFSVLFPLLTLSLQENKNTQLLCFAGVVIFTFKKKSFIMKLYFSLALLQMNTRVALLHDIPSSGSFWPIPLTVQFGTKHTQQDPDSHFTLTIPQLDRKSTGSLDHPGYRVISFPCRLFHTNKTNSVNAELPIIANNVAVLVTLQRTAFCQ